MRILHNYAVFDKFLSRKYVIFQQISTRVDCSSILHNIKFVKATRKKSVLKINFFKGGKSGVDNPVCQ